MVVAVQQPQRRESDLDTIAKALGIAKTVFDIKSSITPKEISKEEKRLRELQVKSAEQKVAQGEAESGLRQAISSGQASPGQVRTLVSQGFLPATGKNQGDVQLSILPGEEGGEAQSVSLISPARQKFQESQARQQLAFEQQKFNNEMKSFQAALASERNEREKAKIKAEGVRKIGDTIEKRGITDIMTSMRKLDKKIDIDGSSDIPGVGGVANLAEAPIIGGAVESLLSKEGKEVRQLVANVRNTVLKSRSGAAVTDPELKRFLDEIGQGTFKGDEQLRTGLQLLRDFLRDQVLAVEAQSDPEFLAEFQSREGSLSSADPFFNSAPQDFERGQFPQTPGGTTAGPGDFDADAFLRGP